MTTPNATPDVTPPLSLIPMERYAIEGLQAQADGAQARYEGEMRAVAERNRAICDAIGHRLGLPEGALGQTHIIDKATWTVAEKPPVTDPA